MFSTLLTSHAEILLLNDDASANIPSMFSTLLTSHCEISSLNVSYVEQYPPPTSFQSESYRLNKFDMSVTALVFQSLMCPYVASALVASLHQAVTAVWRLVESVMAVVESRRRRRSASFFFFVRAEALATASSAAVTEEEL